MKGRPLHHRGNWESCRGRQGWVGAGQGLGRGRAGAEQGRGRGQQGWAGAGQGLAGLGRGWQGACLSGLGAASTGQAQLTVASTADQAVVCWLWPRWDFPSNISIVFSNWKSCALGAGRKHLCRKVETAWISRICASQLLLWQLLRPC